MVQEVLYYPGSLIRSQGRENIPTMSMNDRKDTSCGPRMMRLFPHAPALLLAFLLAQLCSALPLFLVKSARGKCVTAVAAEGTTVEVNYEAPGTSLSTRVGYVFYSFRVLLTLRDSQILLWTSPIQTMGRLGSPFDHGNQTSK